MKPQLDTPKWQNRKPLVAILLIVFWPIGLYGLWRSDRFKRPWKITLTALVLISTLLVFAKQESPTGGRPLPSSTVSTDGDSSPPEAVEDLPRIEYATAQSLLEDRAEAPHPRGNIYVPDSGREWDWKYDLVLPFTAWLSTQPIADIVLSVELEDDSLVGVQQAVIICTQEPVMTPLQKSGLLLRLVADSDFPIGSVPIAFAVGDTIVSRWDTLHYKALMDEEVGAYPDVARLTNYPEDCTLGEKQRIRDAYFQDLTSWKTRFRDFKRKVFLEAEVPYSE